VNEIQKKLMNQSFKEYEIMRNSRINTSFPDIIRLMDRLLRRLNIYNSRIYSIDIYFNLIWYMNIAQNSDNTNLNQKEKDYIGALSVQELTDLLGPRYQGPHDFASLVFACHSGRSAPLPELINIPDYPVVTQMPIVAIDKLCNKFGMYENRYIATPYPPYIFVALHLDMLSPLIKDLIHQVNDDNVNQMMADYGIVSGRNLENPVAYFIEQIIDYNDYFIRPKDILPPPDLRGYDEDIIGPILFPYTLKEIADAYEPTRAWSGRDELIEIVTEERTAGSRWGWRHNFCNNDANMNILEGIPHGEVNKDDPNDPTISYGVMRNYRCYQLSELLSSFTEYEGDFRFRNPDWTPPEVVAPPLDPITGQPLAEEFPLDSMVDLIHVLERGPQTNFTHALIIKIQNGIQARRDTVMALRRLKTTYNTFSDDLKNFIRTYLAWVFICAMWMRFWKGPGTPWAERVEELGTEIRCDPTTRDEHISIQAGIYNLLRESYQKDASLNQWIKNLPVVFYDFQSGAPDIKEETLDHYLNKIFYQFHCMGWGGNRTIQTAYYLITYILDINSDEQFNAFIAEQMPIVLGLEKMVVDGLLLGMKSTDDPEKYRVLMERQKALNQPISSLPAFNPQNVGETIHVN
jgi:hypothetical protein